VATDNSATRRAVLKALGAGALVASAAACAPVPMASPKYARPYSRKPFAAPKVSMDNVIRVITGHRPYRPKGFVVRSEDMDSKLIVHNYGHGGAGISLSWGSSALAVRETLGRKPGSVAVIGSGIMGLTSARLLQDAGWDVTIYTRDVYRHTTSNVAAGEWGPFSAHDPTQSSDAFKSQLEWAARISHHAYTNLTGPKYGIRWLEFYELSTVPFGPLDPEDAIADLSSFNGELGPGEHPFPTNYVRHAVTMQLDPGVLLRRLVEDYQIAGGKFVVRNFANVSEILSLAEPVIFNCTGLGAAKLFGDDNLVPAKGQLVFMPPDPAVDYMTFGGVDGQTFVNGGFLHMFPRSDVILMGGIFKEGDYTTHVEDDETERIVTEHQKLFADFG
jgi:glycine/D-amino acid oxidase-like deaminating enzyme